MLPLLTGAGAKADADDAARARRVETTADFILLLLRVVRRVSIVLVVSTCV